jgi:hypothetical protein
VELFQKSTVFERIVKRGMKIHCSVLSMKSMRYDTGNPIASRILTAGLLPRRQLRCSWLCQGDTTLPPPRAAGKHGLHLSWCNLDSAYRPRNPVTLHGASRISHDVSEFVFSRTGRTVIRRYCAIFRHPAIGVACGE